MTQPGTLTDQEIEDFYRTHRIPTTGDAVALFQAMIAATWIGIVGDPDTPPMASATMKLVDGKAVMRPVLTRAELEGLLPRLPELEPLDDVPADSRAAGEYYRAIL